MNRNDDLTADRYILLHSQHSTKLFANILEVRGSELEVKSRQIKLPVERQS